MIAVDTNILVYAHRADSQHHEAARSTLQSLAAGSARFAIPWPCIHEFLAICTHPRIYEPPSTPAEALQAVESLRELPNIVLLSEAPDHLKQLLELTTRANIRGPKIHDARIAAICIAHGVDELLTADRDFSYFPALRTRNPLITTER